MGNKMSEPITEAELDVIKARAAEVFTGPRMAADREELLRAFGENVPRLTQEIRRLRGEIEIFQGAPDETLGVERYIDNLYDRMCKIFEFEQDGCGNEIRRLLFQILKHARMRGYSQGAHNYAKEQRALRAQLDTEILRRDSLDETLNNAVADHKKDLTKLATVRKAAAPIIKELENETVKRIEEHHPLTLARVYTKDIRALADALKELP